MTDETTAVETPPTIETPQEAPATLPVAVPAKNLPSVESVKARIVVFEEIRDAKIQTAEAELKAQIESIKAKFAAQQKDEIVEVRKGLKLAKEQARTACKTGCKAWNQVLKGLEADVVATSDTPQEEAGDSTVAEAKDAPATEAPAETA